MWTDQGSHVSTNENIFNVNKTQLDAQLILSILRQPLHVSGVSRPIIRRYNRMYTAVGRLQLKCDGTGWRTGGKVKGKLAKEVDSQYSSHYLGTWCIQHYYRWWAELTPLADLNGLIRFAVRLNLVSARVPSHFKGLYLLFYLDDCLLLWWNPTKTTDSHPKRIINTNCCIHTVVPPDDGHRYARNMLVKGTAIPLQAWSGPQGSRKLRFPDYMTTQDGGKVVSLTLRPPLHPRKCSWYSFLLEAESTPGP
jgi:hypothetical protein